MTPGYPAAGVAVTRALAEMTARLQYDDLPGVVRERAAMFVSMQSASCWAPCRSTATTTR